MFPVSCTIVAFPWGPAVAWEGVEGSPPYPHLNSIFRVQRTSKRGCVRRVRYGRIILPHVCCPVSPPPRAPPSLCFGASNQPIDCSVCEEGYAPGLSYGCNSCSDGVSLMVTAVVLIAVAVVVVVIIGLDLTAVGGAAGSATSRRGLDAKFRRLKAFIPFHSLKIAVVSWQIITQVSWSGGSGGLIH